MESEAFPLVTNHPLTVGEVVVPDCSQPRALVRIVSLVRHESFANLGLGDRYEYMIEPVPGAAILLVD